MDRKKPRYGDDRFDAVTLYALASEEGFPESDEAKERVRRSAKMGFAPAQSQVGIMMRDGDMEGDDQEAVKWFRKAVKQGFIDAMVELGRVYESSEHLQDKAQAFVLYAKAICATKEAPEPEYGIGLKDIRDAAFRALSSLLDEVRGLNEGKNGNTILRWDDGTKARINLYALAGSVRKVARKKPETAG